MDWREKQRCVLCNKGGKLLVCNDTGCPISVHKNCMGCKARFDDLGNFYCPYCLYRRLTAETCQLRDKAILAKKALSTFLDEEMRDEKSQEATAGMANKKDQISSTDKSRLESENNMVNDDVRNQSIHLGEHQQSKTPLPCEETDVTLICKQKDGFSNSSEEISGFNNGNTCRIMVVYEANSKPDAACSVDCVSCIGKGLKPCELELDVGKRIGRIESTECKRDRAVDNQQHDVSIQKEVRPGNTVILSSMEKQKHTFKEKRSRTKEGMVEQETTVIHIDRKRKQLGSNDENETRRKKHVTRQQAGVSDDDLDLDDPNFSKQQRNSRNRPTRFLNPQNGARKGSLEAAIAPKIVESGDPGEPKGSSKQQSIINRSTNPPFMNGKRRVRWTEEEEDMLKEGVQKFSLTMHKNLPWKKVLEFGRHVFDASRTPSDLKDKWRNMTK